MKYVVWLDELANENVSNKLSSLAALSKANFPIPKGFIITKEAHELFLKSIDARISPLLKALEESKDVDDIAHKINREVFEKLNR